MNAPDARAPIAGRPREADTGDAGSGWEGIYKVAAVAALIGVLLVLADIGISILLPGEEAEPGTRSATDWFALFRDDAYYGFRELGLLNVLNLILGIPLFLALYAAHRRVNRGYAALALALFLFGGAVYVANNAAVPMFALSGEYTAATTHARRAALAAAGEAVLARGADFTPGSLVGFVLPSLAQITMSILMLRGGVFGWATAYAGIVGFSLLFVFTVWTTFAPGALEAAMLIALPAGLLVVAWNVLVARRLFGLAGGREKERHTYEAKRSAQR